MNVNDDKEEKYPRCRTPRYNKKTKNNLSASLSKITGFLNNIILIHKKLDKVNQQLSPNKLHVYKAVAKETGRTSGIQIKIFYG